MDSHQEGVPQSSRKVLTGCLALVGFFFCDLCNFHYQKKNKNKKQKGGSHIVCSRHLSVRGVWSGLWSAPWCGHPLNCLSVLNAAVSFLRFGNIYFFSLVDPLK